MSSFGSNSTRKMLKNWSEFNGGLPRWLAGAGKNFCDEARQAVEQVTQGAFTVSVFGGFHNPTGQSPGQLELKSVLTLP